MSEANIAQIISMFSGSPFLVILLTIVIVCAGLFFIYYLYSNFKNKLSLDNQNFSTSKDIIDRISEENIRLTNHNNKLQEEIKALNLSISVQHLNSSKMLDELTKSELLIREKDFEILNLKRKLRQYSEIEDDLQ